MWLLILLTAVIFIINKEIEAGGNQQYNPPGSHYGSGFSSGGVASGHQASGLRLVYAWRQVDFKFPNPQARAFAIETGWFIPELAVNPIGIAAAGSRAFLGMPRWRQGVPATLATIPFPPSSPQHFTNETRPSAPPLTPYPHWSWHRPGNCEGLTSVYRVKVDDCGRLWVLDTGVVASKKVCPAQVVAFNLADDSEVLRYRFPESILRAESLPGSLEVEYPTTTIAQASSGSRNCGAPSSAVLYAADVTTFSLLVVDLASKRAWRVRDKTMFPSVEAGTISINGESLELMDGVAGIALGPITRGHGERLLYYSPLSSFRQHWVNTAILRNESAASNSPLAYHTSVGLRPSQSVGCGMDRQGVLFFGLLGQNAIACWNSQKPFVAQNIALLAQDDVVLQYPATVTVDPQGRLWAISARIHKFFLKTMDPQEINFRVFMARDSEAAVRGTVCDKSHNVWPA